MMKCCNASSNNPYVIQGTDLVNFLSSHNTKRSVVILDEFDKTSDEVQNGFLRIFDKGEH